MQYIEDVAKRINDFESKTGVPREAIVQKLEEIYKNIQIQDEQKRQKIALLKTLSYFRRELGTTISKLKTYRGIVIGMDATKDRIQILKNRAKKLFEQNPEESIQQGITFEDGTPRDTRERIRFRTNPKYGEPLQGSELFKTIYFLASPSDDNNYQIYRSVVEGDLCTEISNKLPMYEPIEFKAVERTISRTGEKILVLSSKYVNFSKIQMDMKELIDKLPVIKVGELESWVSLNTQKNKPVILKGVVVNINTETTDTRKSRYITLGDYESDSLVTCFLHDELKIDFGYDDAVMVVGIPRVAKDRYTVNALGIYRLEDTDLV